MRPTTDFAPEGEINNAETPRPQRNRNNIKRSAEKTKNEILKTLSENLKHDTIDLDRQFLMSLLPHVKKIDERCKLDFQSDILQLIKKYTHNQNYETYSAQYYGYSFGNANIFTTQISTTSIQPSPVIQPSPTHSYYSDQSMDNSSIIADMFRDDDE